MSLPLEVLDEILSYLPPDDRQSFRNSSLVAKSWIVPSQRRIFETVHIRTTTFQSLRNSIPLSKDGPLQHVRSLYYILDDRWMHSGPQPEYYVSVLRDHFPFLHRLRHLFLSFVCLPSAISQELWMFSTFQRTLSQLYLDHCDVTICALITLLNYFPNLNCLGLNQLLHEVDDKSPPPLSRPLPRQLLITEDDPSLLDQLSQLGLGFDEITLNTRLHPCSCTNTRIPEQTLERIVDAVGVSVKRLRLLDPLEGISHHRQGPLRDSLNHTPCSYRWCGRWTYNSLSLSGTPGIRDSYELSGASSIKPPLFHHLHKDSKGNVCLRTPNASRRLETYG